MQQQTLRVAAAATLGALGAGIVALALGTRYADDLSVIVGFGLGTAVVGIVLSIGLLAWTYLSDAEGDALYLYPATTASTSALLLVSVLDSAATGAEGTALPLALVGAAVLVVVGMALVFVEQVRATGG
jgi:hypothetical protein